jgi:sn-glycerol 3-phosphate transport system permease protein
MLGLVPRNWIGSPDTALYTLMVVTVWNQAGFFMIFYLAALQAIPMSLREAAAIEGCPRWTYFRRVTWPLLAPTTLFLSVNATINAFRMIDHVFVMTNGGPNNASTLLLFYIYETGFRFWDTAYAATLTVVMLGILVLFGIGQFLLIDRKVHYR